MTDYSRWSRYDVDGELEKTTEKLLLDDFVQANAHETSAAVKELVDAQAKALRIAEALRSRDAVEALKSRSALKNRRRGEDSSSSAAATQTSSSASEIDTTTAATRPPLPPQTETGGDDDPRETSSLTLQLAEAIQSVSATLIRLVAEAEALARTATSPGQQQAGVALGLQILYQVERFRNEEFQPALDLHERVREQEASSQSVGVGVGVGDASFGGSSLEKVEASLSGLLKQVALHLSLCAVCAGEFPLAADVARHRLKMETPRTLADATSTLAPVWMVRALAFAGMGSAYLATTHCRRAKECAPSYPNIEALLGHLEACLDAACSQTTASDSKENGKVSCDVVRELTRRVQALFSDQVAVRIEGVFDVSVEALSKLLSLPPTKDAETPDATSLHQTLSHLWSQHMPRALSLLRQLFYEGQALFLEATYQSAETRYYTAILLGQALPDGKEQMEGVRRHVLAVVSSSYSNAAMCRVHRDKAWSMATMANTNTGEIQPTSTAAELVALSCVSLGAKALSLLDSLAGRVRYSLVLEGARLYSQALSVLDSCESTFLCVGEDESDSLPLPAGPFVTPCPSKPQSRVFSQLYLHGLPLALPFSAEAQEVTRGEARALLAERRARVEYQLERHGDATSDD